MLLGPVFQAELLRTARRRRYYAARLFYGLLLLFVIWAMYADSVHGRAMVTIDQAARFALNTFIAFASVQYVAILLLIPALFGGAIADEKQRKTLHYLMASRLSSFEIVVDKLLGRGAHVAVFFGLGLPVVCLLGLIGGVPPEYVVLAYVGTFSTASMAIALTVLVSTVSRRVRQSVLISYVLLLGWQFVPVILSTAGARLYPITYSWIEPINTWVGATSPLHIYGLSVMRMMGGPRGLPAWVFEQFVWMVGLQLAASALFIFLAVWRLRPAFRRHEATQPRRKWFEGKPKARRTRAPRWYDRPECGGDAMGWKERYFARTDIFTKLVVLPATVMVSVVLVLYVGLDESLLRAFSDLWLWHGGQRAWGVNAALVGHVRVVSAWYVAIWLLSVAGSTASSVAIEREEDTWVSLTSTPLSGWEILRGKVLGAVWAQRGFAMAPLGLWAIALVTGAVHPLGILGTIVAFVVVSWMVAAVGIHASLRATSTSKALTSTIAALAVLYGYPFLLFELIRMADGRYFVTYLGWPPRLVVAPLVSYQAFREIPPFDLAHLYRDDRWTGLMILASYGGVAAALTIRSVTRFDAWLDRPTLSSDPRPPLDRPRPHVEVAEPSLQS